MLEKTVSIRTLKVCNIGPSRLVLEWDIARNLLVLLEWFQILMLLWGKLTVSIRLPRQGKLTLIMKGEVSVTLTSSSLLVRTRLFWKWKKIPSLSWSSWLLTSQDKEVSCTDTSPFRTKVSVPCPRCSSMVDCHQRVLQTPEGKMVYQFIAYCYNFKMPFWV